MDFPAPRNRAGLVAAALLVIAFLVGLGGASILFARPHLAYTLTADALVIDARLGWWPGGRTIPRGAITNPRREAPGPGKRTAGTAVPGFCQGRFRYDGLGAVWQATDCGRKVVALDTPDGVVLVSPADRGEFLRALTSGATGAFSPLPAPPGRPGAEAWIVLALALPLPALAWRVRRPIVYRIDGASLEVPGLMSSKRVGLAGAKVRRVALERVWRLGGASLPGLHVGTYRASIGMLHIAATTLTEGLLVEDGDDRVYVSPADADGFLAAAARGGAIVA
jgi:Bacterial PH domain